MLKKLGRIAALTSMVVGFGAVMPTLSAEAAASTWTLYTTDSGVKGGVAIWSANGDRLEVCDRSADGWAARAQLQHIGTDGYTHQFFATAKGSGTCSVVVKNIPDGRTAWLTVYLTHVDDQTAQLGRHRVNVHT